MQDGFPPATASFSITSIRAARILWSCRSSPPGGRRAARRSFCDLEQVGGRVGELPLAIPAAEPEGVLRANDERGLHGLPRVRDATRVPASQDAHRALRE